MAGMGPDESARMVNMLRELKGRLTNRVQLNGGYAYLSSQILDAPFAFDSFHAAGSPLLRRPKHSGSLLLNYLGSRWGGNLGGSFVGPRSGHLAPRLESAAKRPSDC